MLALTEEVMIFHVTDSSCNRCSWDITWIYIDQDLRRYIVWFGHNEFSPKADFRIVLGSLTGLLDRIR